MKYDVLLFDVDNTILDFDKSEETALANAFAKCGLPYDAHVLNVYRRNNVLQWQRYERGEISRDEVLTNRFLLTLEELDVKNCNIQLLEELYETGLHAGFYKVNHAEEVLRQLLQSGKKLYVVSNGVLSIQNSRMQGSGLDKYFLKRFISEEIGIPKPSVEFFRRSFAQIPNFEKAKALVIGDSLSSDIQGGINVDVDTCWFNPNGTENTSGLQPTYEISDLRELLEIV